MFFSEKNVTQDSTLSQDPYWFALNKSSAIIEFNTQGIILSANKNFLNLTGYSLSEIVGQHHRIFCTENQTNNLEYQKFWNTLNSGEYLCETFRRKDKYGNTLWLEASYNPIIKNNKVFKILKIASNVTEKVEASNNNLFMIEAINKSLAIIEFNTDGFILDANDNFLKVTGYHKNEIVGKHHKLFCDSTIIQSNDYSQFWQNLNKGHFNTGQYPRIGKNKKNIWLEATYNPLFNSDGQVTKIIKVAKDITHNIQNRISDEHNATIVHSISNNATTTSKDNRASMEKTLTKVQEIQSMLSKSCNMMETLNGKMKSINELVEKIKEISHQTHLLSLNAAIEAAHAGKYGKGFSVVAAEVKNLAHKTQMASNDISKFINSINTDSESTLDILQSCNQKGIETNLATIDVQKGLEVIESELYILLQTINKFSNIHDKS